MLVIAHSPEIDGHTKAINILLQSAKIRARVFGAFCCVVFAVAPAGVLPKRGLPVVHAHSNESKKAGSALFHERGCEHCHGANGTGGERGPDLSTVGKRLKKEQIEHQIRDGGAMMPAFGDVLQPDEIKDLVDFLHDKRKAPKNAAVTSKSPQQ